MKQIIKKLFLLFILLAAVTSLSSCRKGGINGDLDGQWRIVSIENLSTHEVSEPKNLFYCFYLHTVNLTTGSVAATGIMNYSGKSLKLEFPYHHEPSRLNPWGIYTQEVDFTVEHLSSTHLTLVSSTSKILLKKF